MSKVRLRTLFYWCMSERPKLSPSWQYDDGRYGILVNGTQVREYGPGRVDPLP